MNASTKIRRTFKAVCAYCGCTFDAESDRARWCCPAHKQAAYRERKEKRAVTIHTQSHDRPG